MNTKSQVIKRDGSVVDYQPEKVRKALESAFISTGIDRSTINIEGFVDEVNKLFEKENPISVEKIQDTIERYYNISAKKLAFSERVNSRLSAL